MRCVGLNDHPAEVIARTFKTSSNSVSWTGHAAHRPLARTKPCASLQLTEEAYISVNGERASRSNPANSFQSMNFFKRYSLNEIISSKASEPYEVLFLRAYRFIRILCSDFALFTILLFIIAIIGAICKYYGNLWIIDQAIYFHIPLTNSGSIASGFIIIVWIIGLISFGAYARMPAVGILRWWGRWCFNICVMYIIIAALSLIRLFWTFHIGPDLYYWFLLLTEPFMELLHRNGAQAILSIGSLYVIDRIDAALTEKKKRTSLKR